jgi:hypothetical protein
VLVILYVWWRKRKHKTLSDVALEKAEHVAEKQAHHSAHSAPANPPSNP